MPAIEYLLNEQTIKQFTTHDTVESLNATYWAQINANSESLTKTEREIYYKLSQYSAKYPGAAYLTANTMAKLIDKSRSTVMRAYRVLKALNMIEVIPCKRKSDNRQTASIIRILPLQVEVTAENTPTCESNSEVAGEVGAVENAQSDKAKSSVESINETQSDTQGLPEVTHQEPLSLSTIKSFKDLTFDTGKCSALTVLNAFNIDQSLIRAIQPLALSTSKQVELLNGGIVTHLQIALSRKFPAFMRNFDILAHLDAIQSAAIRTAYVAKRKQVRNVVGYFLRTLVALISGSFEELASDIAVEAAEVEGYAGYDAVMYARREGKSLAQGSGLERVLTLINEHYGINQTNQTNTEVIA
ncbi:MULTISPECIES: hypothetical protein [Exiguobacterium]|uniref:hypothetical protein n=1 Tax=Exiguobacterium TaxID=33986 RepID=UPI001BE4EF8F|nr:MULTISPECIES: hypothetical protein [Exiguobacterium]MCT4792858.1 hypothetical protein [Exiguobacterium artemiae]